MNKCTICNVNFKAPRKSIKCCSDKCRGIAKNAYDRGLTLTNRCVMCEKVFKTNRINAKYCSDYCRKISRYVESTCTVCGERFLGRKFTKTCSSSCRKRYTTEKDLKELTCMYCSQMFKRSNAYLGAGNLTKKHFCSHSCANKDYVYRTYGKMNKYSSDWGSTRKKVFKLYGEQCLQCESTSRIEVHHVVPKQYFVINPKLADNIEYLIPLCKKCHTKTHKTNNDWFEKHFKNIESLLLLKDIV